MTRRKSDEAQRARLARIIRDPANYFADARREAHVQARRWVDTRLQPQHSN